MLKEPKYFHPISSFLSIVPHFLFPMYFALLFIQYLLTFLPFILHSIFSSYLRYFLYLILFWGVSVNSILCCNLFLKLSFTPFSFSLIRFFNPLIFIFSYAFLNFQSLGFMPTFLKYLTTNSSFILDFFYLIHLSCLPQN